MYLHSPYVSMFLEINLFLTKSQKILRGDIFDAGSEVNFPPIIDWIQTSLTRNSGYGQPSPLVMPRSIDPLMDGDLLRHHHNVLIRHLHGQDRSIQNSQVFLISTHIGEVVVNFLRDCK